MTTIKELAAVLPEPEEDVLARRVADAEAKVLRRAIAAGRARQAIPGCQGLELTNRIKALVSARMEEDVAVDEWMAVLQQQAAKERD